MTDEDKLRLGFNASISGYQHQWGRFVDEQPYDQTVYKGYFQLLEQMLTVLVEGAKILENKAWVHAIGNFRAAHSDSLKRFVEDLWHLRDRLPESGYDQIKRAVLEHRHERARGSKNL